MSSPFDAAFAAHRCICGCCVVCSRRNPGQSTTSHDTSSSASYSSSQSGLTQAEMAEFSLPEAPCPALLRPLQAGAAAASTQPARSTAFCTVGPSRQAAVSTRREQLDHLGGQFTVGAGLKFNKYLSTLVEYQFLDSKLPGYLIAEAGATAATRISGPSPSTR